MTRAARHPLSATRRVLRGAGIPVAIALAGALGLICAVPSRAQAPNVVKAVSKPAEQGLRWSELKREQQSALKPLEHQWAAIEAPRKQKWVELSSRFSKLTPDEQARVQQRMSEWAKLTPRERGEARMNYQEAKQVPAQDRQARWKAYEALSAEKKQQLAARAAPPSSSTLAEAARNSGPPSSRTDLTSRDSAPQAKSNIVPNPSFAAPPRAVGPTVVQAHPGATTTLVTKRATPPGHQQTGMPKIAATPEFVNKATLLPRRGPQGAATRSSSAAASETTPQR